MDPLKLTISNDLDDILEKTLNQSPSNLALLLKFLYYDTVRFNGKVWYHFKDHRWQISDNTPLEDIVKNHLINRYLDLTNTYNNLVIEYQSLMAQEQEGSKNIIPYELTINDLIYKSKLCSDLCVMLNNHTFIQKILAVGEHVFLEKDFEYTIDLQPQLLGFNNGVYDLDQKKLNIGHSSDLISMTVGYDFQYNDGTPSKILNQLNLFFNNKSQISKDFLTQIRKMLHGNQRYPVIQVYGLDNAGIEFFETLLSKCLGDYLGRLPISLLSKKKFSYKETNSELVDNCKKRICLMSQGFETISNEDFNLDMMDKLLVENSLHIRKAYDKLNDYHPQFGLVVLSDLKEVEPQPGMLTFEGCKLGDQIEICDSGVEIMKLLMT